MENKQTTNISFDRFFEKYFDSINLQEVVDLDNDDSKKLSIHQLNDLYEGINNLNKEVALYTLIFVSSYNKKYGFNDAASNYIFSLTDHDTRVGLIRKYLEDTNNDYPSFLDLLKDNGHGYVESLRILIAICETNDIKHNENIDNNTLDRINEIINGVSWDDLGILGK